MMTNAQAALLAATQMHSGKSRTSNADIRTEAAQFHNWLQKVDRVMAEAKEAEAKETEEPNPNLRQYAKGGDPDILATAHVKRIVADGTFRVPLYLNASEEHKHFVQSWLTANQIEPNDVLDGQSALVAEGKIIYISLVRDKRGNVVWQGDDGLAVKEAKSVPYLTSPLGYGLDVEPVES